MKSRASRLFVAIFGVVAIVFAACGPTFQPSETPQQGGRVVYGINADITTLAPHLASTSSSAAVVAMIYDALMVADPQTGEPRPNLGRWTVSADGLTYDWTVGADAKWTDGQPITGRDYLVAVQLIAKSPAVFRKPNVQDIAGFADYAAGRADTISGIRVDPNDPKHFTVTFSRVYCPALVNAFGTSVPPLPAHVWSKYLTTPASIDAAPEATQPTVTSGAFRFTEWRRGDQVILDRNPDYWQGAPLVDQFVWKVLPDATSIASQLKTGEINLGNIEPQFVADIGAQSGLEIHRFPSLAYVFIGWNTRSPSVPALGDKRVRQALMYGLDMDAIVRSIVLGEGTRVVQHHPPSSWAAAPASALNAYTYDPARAEQLLRDAGYTRGADNIYARDGRPLAITVMAQPGPSVRASLLEVAVEQYRQIGIRINPVTEQLGAIAGKISGGAPDVEGFVLAWSLGIEPDATSPWHSSQIPDSSTGKTGFNAARFANSGLDQALDRGATGDCSQSARKSAYESMNRILNDEVPWTFAFSPNNLLVAPSNMRGMQFGTYGVFVNMHRWWYKS